MKRIITITFNPCIDKHTEIKKLKATTKLDCGEPFYQPGGGGINVARVLRRLGADPLALYPSGGVNGEYITSLLLKEKVRCKRIKIQRTTRENILVHELSGERQFRFGMPGPKLNKREWNACLNYVKEADEFDFVVASGSLPPGVPTDVYGQLADITTQKGAKLIMDTSGEPLKQLKDKRVYILKPNQNELCQLIGKEINSHEEMMQGARQVVAKKWCEILIVSLGKEGALVVTAKDHYFIAAPKDHAVNSVGSGDNMVDVIVYALSKKQQLQEAVQYGLACGGAATLRKGTALFRKKDVSDLLSIIQNSYHLAAI